jgi:RimJ/RimL family protein N-acetyltransferase
MCAITRFDGADHAYTLHIGVESRYRRRKLGQAVQVLGLRYARDVLQTHSVRNSCNIKNLPVLALNRKLGYALVRGTCSMQKMLK